MMVRNQMVLGVTINGVELPLDDLTVIKCFVQTSIRQYIPVGELVFTDANDLVSRSITLGDGVPVEIVMGTSLTLSRTYNMRAFKHTVASGPTGVAYRLFLYADLPMYWQGRAPSEVTGNASDVITFIAQETGIQTAFVDPTADSMTWLPLNARWCQWAHKVAQAAYADATSGFALGIRLDLSLAFKNVSAYLYDSAVDPLLTNVPASDSSVLIPVRGHKVVDASGYANMQGGYAGRAIQQGGTSANTTVYSEVSKVRATESLLMSEDIRRIVSEVAPLSPGIMDAGNVHPNYHRALYQNKRLGVLNSRIIGITTDVFTLLDLCDRGNLQLYGSPINGEPQLNQDVSGNTFVGAKTAYVGLEGIYCERLTLLTSGRNTDPQGTKGQV